MHDRFIRHVLGSSPRVRSRHDLDGHGHVPVGIISACAEQTSLLKHATRFLRDHLRVCGADLRGLIGVPTADGSSPRVRSRPEVDAQLVHEEGIISACAEQTPDSCPVGAFSWDHLRVCGADGLGEGRFPSHRGSSPRVRSRQRCVERAEIAGGIISACAEQTTTSAPSSHPRRDHLRVCGADSGRPKWPGALAGSSPRVRSRQLLRVAAPRMEGIISACAEQTACSVTVVSMLRDHLRVCGADP